MIAGWTDTGASLWLVTCAATLVAGAGALSATRTALAYLQRHQLLDRPNDRSSHTIPTPRGGGLGVVPPLLVVWAGLAATGPGAGWAWRIMGGAAVLMAASWLDDRRSLPALPRLLLQAAMVGMAVAALPAGAHVLPAWVPMPIDRILTGLVWLWFVNLFNFMDGIDGITGIETFSLGLGIVLVAVFSGAAMGLIPFAAATGAAGLAFLAWNWHPARVFLGDVGSIPLGFILGGLLVHLATAGLLTAALILPAIYLADTSITLVRRLARGEAIWQAHRQHFYQQPVKAGYGHDQVARVILIANAALIAAALIAIDRPAFAAAAAAVIVIGVLILFQRWGQTEP